jgi:hypothetical protein
MRRFLIACTLLLLATPAMAQRDGLYDVTGTNLDGTTYSGLAQIRALGLNSFAIVWRTGSDVVEGVGMASGRTIAVAYGLAQRPGLGIYTLNPDGSLDGEWTVVGANGMGRERLVPRPTPTAGTGPGAPQAPAPPAVTPPAAPPATSPPRR